MKPLLIAFILVVSYVETATAQFFCNPLLPPPPPPVYVSTPIIVVEPLPVLLPLLPAEEWREVRYCDVQYTLNGQVFHVATDGSHFRLGKTSSELSANAFVEPFCPLSGRRVVKTLHDVPQGATLRYQDGVKTIYVVDGFEYFATWIEVGNSIKSVWCQRLASTIEPTPSTAPTPDPAFQQGREQRAPLVIPSEIVPQRRQSEPSLPELLPPSFDEDPFTKDRSNVREYEPTKAEPKKYDPPSGPVASRAVRI